MLDGVERVQRPVAAERTVAGTTAQCSLEVWIRWRADAASLRGFVKPRAAMEQFTMTQAERCERDPTIWRCAFLHVGRRINIDHQVLSLLRRLSPAAPWLKAERIDLPEALDDDPRELDWDDFARRALP